MTQQAPSALAKPSTEAPKMGARLVTGPASDVAQAPRANAPPPDLRGNAREAARRAAAAARDGASVADALAAAKASPAVAETPTPTPAADQEPRAPEASVESQPSPAEESPIDVRTRVRQREQRMQRELAEREQRLNAERARFDQERQAFETDRQRYARLDQLKKSDPVAWAKEVELDPILEPIVKARIAAGKPEGIAMTAQQEIAALRAEIEAEKAERARQADIARRAQSERAFVDLATKNPIVAAFYEGDAARLVGDAWTTQARFAAQYRRAPTQDELVANLEHVIKHSAARAAKLLGATTSAPVASFPPAAAAKPRAPSPSEQTRTAPVQRAERIETDRERRERAAREAKKAIQGANKRMVRQ